MAGLVAAAVSGCAVGPDYQRPEAALPAALTRSPLATAGTAGPVQDAWWTAFGSPALDRLVADALGRSPTLEAAQATLRAAHENVVAQRGFFFPAVQAGLGNSRQNVGQSQSAPLASGDSLYTYHTAQLSVGFAPDIFGGNRRQVEGLMAQEQGQRYQLEATRLTLASNLVGAVLQAAMLADQCRLTEQAVAAMQEQLRIMRNLQRSGYASGLDVATQENLLTQLQQTLTPLQKQLEQTRNLVAVLGGRTPDTALPALDLASIAMPALPTVLPSDVVRQRPDIRIAETQAHAASAAIGAAKAARLPQISLTAALGGGATRVADMFSSGNVVWSLGANLLQPIFDGGTLAARQRAAQAQYEASAAQFRSTVLGAFQNVADVLYALEVDDRAVRAAENSAAATRTSFDLVQSQLRQGYASQPAVLAAQQAWLQSQAALVAARGAMLGDAVALYQAAGGGVLAKEKEEEKEPG